MEYTKGKFKDGSTGWRLHKRAEPIGFAEFEIHFSDDGECVAEVVHEEGNAKLIAAAPELLNTLQEIFDYTKGVAIGSKEYQIHMLCYSKIKKATE